MSIILLDGYQKSSKTIDKTQEQFSYWNDIICDEYVHLDCERPKGTDNYSAFDAELRGGMSLDKMRFSEVIANAHKVERTKSHIAKATKEDYLISFQLSSQGVIRQNSRQAILTPGTFALYDSTEPYSLSFNESFHQLVVQMPKTILKQHLVNPEQYTAIQMCGRSGLGAILVNFVLSLAKEIDQLNEVPDDLSDNMLHLMAMAFSSSVMLGQVGNNSLVKESLKQRVYRYIELNLCNPDINNQMIADSQGISLSYLNKLFAQENESVHALILEKRLDKSLSLMKNPAYSGHSIEKVAYSVGFASAAHFSRSFKKHYGYNPSHIKA